jgi:hypothetical protein
VARIRTLSPAQRRHVATARRDDALARLCTITGGIGVAVVLAVGVIGVYVGKALPGHHATPASNSSVGQSGGAVGNTGTGQGGTAAGSGALNPPTAPPQGSSVPAPVTSGSS